MGVEQYQRKVNSLDKEIADLEKKKAEEDRKAADNHKKASRVSVSKNASESMIKSKMRQIENYEEKARKAEAASADYGKKISDKRTKRNDAYLKLQKEEQNERKKQEKSIENMKRVYEQRISELESLRLSKVKVWYDKSKIKWGDSMRARIDDGLRKSKFGVAILSPNYIAEGKYWTKAELDGLFQMESINGKTLLPIWHNLTKKQVMDYSPILASKLAMTTATMTAEEIADELLDMLSSEEDK